MHTRTENNELRDIHKEKPGLNFRIKLISWNAQSLCSQEKFDFCRMMNCDILAIQEVWAPPKEILCQFSNYYVLQRKSTRGGGTLISIQNETMSVVRQIQISEDVQLLKVIAFQERYYGWPLFTYPKEAGEKFKRYFKKYNLSYIRLKSEILL
jgi:hypothetical protein